MATQSRLKGLPLMVFVAPIRHSVQSLVDDLRQAVFGHCKTPETDIISAQTIVLRVDIMGNEEIATSLVLVAARIDHPIHTLARKGLITKKDLRWRYPINSIKQHRLAKLYFPGVAEVLDARQKGDDSN